jgi:hypothetical protein
MRNFALVPFSNEDLGNRIFNTPFGVLKDKFHKKNIDINTYDLVDLKDVEQVLFFNYSGSLMDNCSDLGVGKERRILFLYEPCVVYPRQYQKSVLSRFDKVFTWRDDLIDGKKFFKFYSHQAQQRIDKIVPFQEKKHLVLVNAHKFSYIAHELYSLRRKAIRYFENARVNFDLYGYGWDEPRVFQRETIKKAFKSWRFKEYFRDAKDGLNKFMSYRGVTQNKIQTLANYKYCICFENEYSPGYISEKIFDAFFAGTVPVYLGASNIEQYIPPQCFIDMRKFNDFSELIFFLRNIDEKQYARYIEAGEAFIKSETFNNIWSPAGSFNKIIERICNSK